jgi:hypothetical protein
VPDRKQVNAIIELVVPLDGVTVGSSPHEKALALDRVLERITDAFPDWAGASRWEDSNDA